MKFGIRGRERERERVCGRENRLRGLRTVLKGVSEVLHGFFHIFLPECDSSQCVRCAHSSLAVVDVAL